jgi:hypothetical protein
MKNLIAFVKAYIQANYKTFLINVLQLLAVILVVAILQAVLGKELVNLSVLALILWFQIKKKTTKVSVTTTTTTAAPKVAGK